jgi:hypothetical protein
MMTCFGPSELVSFSFILIVDLEGGKLRLEALAPVTLFNWRFISPNQLNVEF